MNSRPWKWGERNVAGARDLLCALGEQIKVCAAPTSMALGWPRKHFGSSAGPSAARRSNCYLLNVGPPTSVTLLNGDKQTAWPTICHVGWRRFYLTSRRAAEQGRSALSQNLCLACADCGRLASRRADLRAFLRRRAWAANKAHHPSQPLSRRPNCAAVKNL